MLLFDSVCITGPEVWVEDRKYIQQDGVLYEIRKGKKGPKTKHKEDQQLFTECLSEIKRIVSQCEPKKQPLRIQECKKPTIEIPPTPPCTPMSSPLSLSPIGTISSFRPLASEHLFHVLPSTSFLRSLLFTPYFQIGQAIFAGKHM